MQYNKIIKKHVLEVFEERGVGIDESAYREYMEGQIETGQNLWDTEIRKVVGEGLFTKYANGDVLGRIGYSKDIPRVLAFGYSMGSLMERITCANHENNRDVSILVSIFNLIISLFDRIYDDHPDIYPFLVERVSRRALRNAVEIESYNGPFFSVDSDENFLDLTLVLLESYLKGLRKLYSLSSNGSVLEELKNSILLMYDSEMSTGELNFWEKRNIDSVYGTLRNVKSMPGWTIYLTTLMSSNAGDTQNFKGMKEDILKIGDIFWIIDDIVDTVEDLENDRWSYTWLKFNSHYEMTDAKGEPLQKDELLHEMTKSPVIPEAADRICDNFIEARSTFNKFFQKEEDFKVPIFSWIKSWLNVL